MTERGLADEIRPMKRGRPRWQDPRGHLARLRVSAEAPDRLSEETGSRAAVEVDGKVLAIHGEQSLVEVNGELCRCNLSGRLKRHRDDVQPVDRIDQTWRRDSRKARGRWVRSREQAPPSSPIAVGDEVRVRMSDHQTGMILDRHERRSWLGRLRPTKGPQVIAANIEIALVVMAVAQPEPNFFLLDQFLIQSAAGGLEPWIVFNKMDLARSEDGGPRTEDGGNRTAESPSSAEDRRGNRDGGRRTQDRVFLNPRLGRYDVSRAQSLVSTGSAAGEPDRVSTLSRFGASPGEGSQHASLPEPPSSVLRPPSAPSTPFLEADFYRSLGYPVFCTSAESREGLNELDAALSGRMAVFVGPSGVGKSALLNDFIPGTEARIGEISEWSGRGQHTTTHVAMYPLPRGGYLVDAPGIRSLALWQITPGDIALHFPEFGAWAIHCDYAACAHLLEPGCAVRSAVESRLISARRYSHYCQLRQDA